jgi:hypothetical protein
MGGPVASRSPFFSQLVMVDPMTVRLETSMVRHQSDVVRRDIMMYSGHPMAVGSEVRVERVGWVTDIL